MKKSLLVLPLLAAALMACSKKEYPPSQPEQAQESNPNVSVVPTVGYDVYITKMSDGTTCYVTYSNGVAMACLRP